MRLNRKGLFGMKADDECLGVFSVPIRCCKEGTSYPHYFNIIRNNEKNGRMIANFYIEPITGIKKDKSPSLKNFEKVNIWLKNKVNTNVEIAILGLRDLNFTISPEKVQLLINITGCKEDQKPKNDLELIHNLDGRKETFLNVLEVFKFNDVDIYGTSDFMIFPILTIKLKFTAFFFFEDERFIIESLKEFYSNQVQNNVESGNKSKMYRLIWEQNLDVKTIDQELVDLFPDPTKKKKKTGDEDDEDEIDEEDEIFVKFEEENKIEKVDTKKNVTELMIIDKEKEKLKDDKKEDKKGVNIDQIDKLLEKIRKYKNMDISNAYTLVCRKADKESERSAKKVLRKGLKKEKKELMKLEVTFIKLKLIAI